LIEAAHLIIFFRMGRKIWFFLGFFFIFALGGLIFFLRSPVLILTDAPFLSLYGNSRARIRGIEASIALFRRVKPVIIAESAGPDIVVFVVEEAAANPYCVIFPPQFAEGARRYAEQFPLIPVVSLENGSGENRGGPGFSGNPGPLPGRMVSLKTRREADFYRAGLCAGIMLLAGGGEGPENSGGGPGNSGEILVFPEQALSGAERSAFLTGLAAQKIAGPPRFFKTAGEIPLARGPSCVVLAGPAGEYLEKNPKNPAILFSWLDPALTVREIFLIFDDSPWALAVPAVKLAVRGETGGNIPSDMIFPRGRIADKRLLQDLKRAARSDLP
jgi:hypothetical protein